jgi:CheY-like chemotaxis protein
VPSKRILVVDDEYTSAETLAWVLRDEGFEVTVAGNGRQALERLDEAAPDLVLTDYMMPLMNGVELSQAIRARPRFARIPVLMISGVSDGALSAHRASFDTFLRKPFDLQRLLDAVRSLLRT